MLLRCDGSKIVPQAFPIMLWLSLVESLVSIVVRCFWLLFSWGSIVISVDVLNKGSFSIVLSCCFEHRALVVDGIDGLAGSIHHHVFKPFLIDVVASCQSILPRCNQFTCHNFPLSRFLDSSSLWCCAAPFDDHARL